ncbi:MAG: 4a-hydroxytetrahydrobiopterin dehydratase [Thaumarchaeota archaeon]|nr:4a-hydroxytetrahydrobiopterin dehydratase [Nitrososphaerota archaeon]
MPRILEPAEITLRLKAVPGWKQEGSFITKVYSFNTFMEGVDFIVRIAGVAERMDHHPDIHVRYTTITLAVQTHSEGGVTRRDFELAEAIEESSVRWKRTR